MWANRHLLSYFPFLSSSLLVIVFVADFGKSFFFNGRFYSTVFVFFIASHGAGKCVSRVYLFTSFSVVVQFKEIYLLRHLSISPVAIPSRFLRSSFLFFAAPLPTLHLLLTYMTFSFWTLNLSFSTFLPSFLFVYITSYFCLYLALYPFTSFNVPSYFYRLVLTSFLFLTYILFYPLIFEWFWKHSFHLIFSKKKEVICLLQRTLKCL